MASIRIAESRFPATCSGPDVTGILVAPDDAFALMVLGHGAATPIREPLMVEMCAALADRGVATFRFNYPYSERSESEYSEDLIDPLEVLLATASSAKHAAQALALELPLFLGGRSMSSQIMSLALSREHWPDVRGLVLYVFPMRWRIVLKDTVSHLRCVPVPMLFVQGGHDEEFADLGELQPVLDQLGTRATLHVTQGADHSFNLPAESGRTREDAIAEAASATSDWMREWL